MAVLNTVKTKISGALEIKETPQSWESNHRAVFELRP